MYWWDSLECHVVVAQLGKQLCRQQVNVTTIKGHKKVNNGCVFVGFCHIKMKIWKHSEHCHLVLESVLTESTLCFWFALQSIAVTPKADWNNVKWQFYKASHCVQGQSNGQPDHSSSLLFLTTCQNHLQELPSLLSLLCGCPCVYMCVNKKGSPLLISLSVIFLVQVVR